MSLHFLRSCMKAMSDRLPTRLRKVRHARHLDTEYQKRLATETENFSGQVNVHDLPEIFHYWSNKHLLPMCESLGFSSPDDFFAQHLARASSGAIHRPARFASIGAGNCDAEIRLALALKQRGIEDFTIDCIDINEAMLARGRASAQQTGVDSQINPTRGDFNAWQPAHRYDAILANQSLHHVLELENLFDAIASALTPEGLFVTADMIGRNGHQRWPEALAIVEEFWCELPSAYRYNRQLERQEERFLDWDCAQQSFEGIRAQDVLPLLIERFGFELFFAYGNVIDPFVDRSFGHHFNIDRDWDRDFIDRVHARDEAELLAGRIKPTHMFAAMRKRDAGTLVCWKHLTPEFCVRRPDAGSGA
jgi:SAM-dependent methyltransferase